MDMSRKASQLTNVNILVYFFSNIFLFIFLFTEMESHHTVNFVSLNPLTILQNKQFIFELFNVIC